MHTRLFTEAEIAKRHGVPFMVIEPAKELDKEPCSLSIYKDPSKVSAK